MDVEKRKWGSAIVVENNPLYCCKILRIKKDYRMSLQYHKLKDETLFLMRGKILIEYKRNDIIYEEVMMPGNKVRIYPFELHRVTGLENSEILEVSTQSFDSDSYHIKEGGLVPK